MVNGQLTEELLGMTGKPSDSDRLTLLPQSWATMTNSMGVPWPCALEEREDLHSRQTTHEGWSFNTCAGGS